MQDLLRRPAAVVAAVIAGCGGPSEPGQTADVSVPVAETEAIVEPVAEMESPLLTLPEISLEKWDVGEKPDLSALEEPIELTFWHAIAQRHEAALNDIVELFEAEHQNISVTPVYQGGYNELRTALFAAMATPSRPVMSQMYESWTSQFAERDLLVPVQAFIDADPDFDEEDLEDFYPGFLQNNTWGDVVVTLPFNKSVYLLFANTDQLAAAGLEMPETWDELRTAANTLTDRDGQRFGFGARPLMETFTPFFMMNGGEFIEGGELNLDGPEAVETLQFLLDLTHEDRVVYIDSNYLTSAFGNQVIALYTGSSAGIPYTETAAGDEFEWTVAPLPSRGDQPRRVLSQGTNVGIYAEHSREVLWAAWEFLKFLTSGESSAHFARISGYLPVRRSSLEVEEFKSHMEEDPIMAVAASQLEFATFEPRMPVWESVRSTLNRQMGQVLQVPTTDAAAVAHRMQREAVESLDQ